MTEDKGMGDSWESLEITCSGRSVLITRAALTEMPREWLVRFAALMQELEQYMGIEESE